MDAPASNPQNPKTPKPHDSLPFVKLIESKISEVLGLKIESDFISVNAQLLDSSGERVLPTSVLVVWLALDKYLKQLLRLGAVVLDIL